MSLFSKKPKNVLKSLPFFDCTLKSLSKYNSHVVMIVSFYDSSLYEITFSGVSRISDDASFEGAEIMNARFGWTEGSWTASFIDDDDEPVLEVVYANAIVQKLVSAS